MLLKSFILLSLVLKIFFMETVCKKGKCPKILEGEYATIEKFPHSVLILITFGEITMLCGSSVLTERIVLTAAHCVREHDENMVEEVPDEIAIMAGHENYDLIQISINVSEHIVHECYTDMFINDIALLFLSEKLPLGPTIKRVVITREFPAGVKKGQVAGWGQTEVQPFVPSNSTILKYVEMKIYTQRKCCKIIRRLAQRVYNSTELKTTYPLGWMCVGDRHTDQFKNQPLKGDSGSALVVPGGNHQIGVTSFMILGFGKKGVAVFTNVTYHYDWILNAKKLYRKNNVAFDKNFILTTVSKINAN